VYGVALSPSAKVTVSVKGPSAAASYTVDAVVTAAVAGGGTGSHWKATLHPTAASHDEYTIEAVSDGVTIALERVVYGDVFFCSGQVTASTRMSRVGTYCL
jgi:hypothetical protein